MVLNGRQALYEALVSRDADFADRVYSHVESRINPKAKGTQQRFRFNLTLRVTEADLC